MAGNVKVMCSWYSIWKLQKWIELFW